MTCNVCNGEGGWDHYVEGILDRHETCQECDGRGYNDDECPYCDGTGTTREGYHCDECDGDGWRR